MNVTVAGTQQQRIGAVAVQPREHRAEMPVVERSELLGSKFQALGIEQFVVVLALDPVGAEKSVGHRLDVFAESIEFRRVVGRDALAGKLVGGFEPHGQDHRSLVALRNVTETDRDIITHGVVPLAVDAAHERVFPGRLVFDPDRARTFDLSVEVLRSVHILSRQAGLTRVEHTLEQREFHRPGIGHERSPNVHDSVSGFALRKGYRVIGNLDSRKQDAEHAVAVGPVEGSGGLLQFDQKTLRREGDDTVPERSVLPGRFVHHKVFRDIGRDPKFTVVSHQRQSGGLVGNENLVGIAGVDKRIEIPALEVHRPAGQRLEHFIAVDLHAVIARDVAALENLHLDLRIGIEARRGERIDVAEDFVAPLSLGMGSVGARHRLPARTDDRERKSRRTRTVERNVARVLDADFAGILHALLGLGEGNREFGLLLAGTERDRLDLKDALFAGRDFDRNGDRIEIFGAADLVGHRRFVGGVHLHFHRRVLLGEVDAVVVGVLFRPLRIGRIVRAAGPYGRCQECP